MKTIGVLALQGGYDPHVRALERSGARAVKVKSLEEIGSVDGLILPGGESTTIGKLLVQHGMKDKLAELIQKGLPVFGTCAGLILLSRGTVGQTQPLLGVLDVTVQRNAYGRQVESFETNLDFQGRVIPALFIRAPQIVTKGPHVQTLIRYENQDVCVRENQILAASFHPELTEFTDVHEYFLGMI